MLRWVARNEDKPHRCPQCHGIAARAWLNTGGGPRTVLKCPWDCGVRWRWGVRTKKYSMRFRQDLERLDRWMRRQGADIH